jgi:hypothetical protein
MRKFLLVSLLALTACGAIRPPKTPEQALVEARASLGSAVAAFNVYTSRRPFCGDTGAKSAPLCADRAVAIQGDHAAHEVADALNRAEATIEALDIRQSQWPALAEPLTLLKNFQAFVAKAKGE